MITIGTRGSDLALWQAEHVAALLRDRAGVETTIQVIQTAGDRIQDRRLDSLPGKGFFTKEIESALLAGNIDLAVHSHKDLPTASPPGLQIAAVPPRGPARENLLVHPDAWETDADGMPLRPGATVGTGSARRRCQLLALRPDLRIEDLRGNVPTRIGKLRRTQPSLHRYDAIVLAEAGLTRLALDPQPLRVLGFSPEEFVPAPAQGALAIQMRDQDAQLAQDEPLRTALRRVHDEQTARLVAAERNVLAALEGGCNLPLGAHARARGEAIVLTAVLGRADGDLVRCTEVDDAPDAVAARVLAVLRSE